MTDSSRRQARLSLIILRWTRRKLRRCATPPGLPGSPRGFFIRSALLRCIL
jgi:hypothetical protein